MTLDFFLLADGNVAVFQYDLEFVLKVTDSES